MKFRTVLFAVLTVALVGQAAAFAEGQKGSVTGRVVDKRGKSIAGARVIASGAADAEATTDEKGEFEIELDPGTYRLEFEADGYATATLRERITVEPGKRTKVKHRVELPESDEGSVVRGSVFDQASRAVSGARVEIERVPGPDGASVAKLEREATSDSMGFFAFRLPKGGGRYRLTATHDKYGTATVTVDLTGGEILNAPPLKLSGGH